MNSAEYTKRKDDLFSRWKQARPEYESEGKRFSDDGIIDYDAWSKSKPKILFLLKENWADEENWEPSWGISSYANLFSKNIALWSNLIKELYYHPEKVLNNDSILIPKKISDLAIMEIKKVNEGKPSSSDHEIQNYAIRDRDFIIEQIELINPDVILCGKTGEIYGDDIYGDEPWDELINIKGKSFGSVSCYKHRNRLIIDFYHPSYWAGSSELFDSLNRMIIEGKVFQFFNWDN